MLFFFSFSPLSFVCEWDLARVYLFSEWETHSHATRMEIVMGMESGKEGGRVVVGGRRRWWGHYTLQ